MRIVVSGGGHAETNGVYYRSSIDGRNDGLKNFPHWCKGSANNCYGGMSAGIFNNYPGYGWGIQTANHHRYQNRAATGATLKQWDSIRGSGGGAVNGQAPIPSFRCTEFEN